MEEQQTTQNQKKSPIITIVIGVILALIVVGGIVLVVSGSQDEEAPSTDSANRSSDNTTTAPPEECTNETGKTEVTLVYDAGENFAPQCMTINSGTTVTYRNESKFALDVGADPHPSHTGNREVSKEEFELPIEPNGGTANTVMTKTGTFGLHNHENASATATIIVE